MVSIFLWTVFVILILATLAATIVLIGISLNKKFGGNKFIGPVPENQIVALVKNGKLDSFVENVPGKVINPATFHMDPAPPGPVRESWFTRLTGLYVLSINPFVEVLQYPFRWTKWAKPTHDPNNPNNSQTQPIEKPEIPVRSLYFRSLYAFILNDMEIAGSTIGVDFVLLPTIEVTNPRTVLFENLPTGVWIDRVTGAVFEQVKSFAIMRKFDQLTGDQHAGQQSELAKLLTSPGFNRRLDERYGVKIIGLDWPVLQEATDEATNQALRAEELARLNGLAAIAKAKAEAEAARIRAQGEADAIRKVSTAETSRAKKLYAQVARSPEASAAYQAEQQKEAVGNFKGQVLSIGGRKQAQVGAFVSTDTPKTDKDTPNSPATPGNQPGNQPTAGGQPPANPRKKRGT